MFELNERRRDELIEKWAPWIVKRGLGPAAVFLLEAHKPLAGIGAHAMLGMRPIVEALAPIDAGELAGFMRNPENLELLIQRIEEQNEQRQDDDTNKAR